MLKAIVAENPSDILKEDVRGNSLMCIACENGFDAIVKYLADNNETLLTKDTPTGNISLLRFHFIQQRSYIEVEFCYLHTKFKPTK